MNFGKQTYQHNFAVSFFSLGPNFWVLCDMTTIEMFSIKVMMKYDDGFQWVGLVILIVPIWVNVGLTPIWSNFPDVHTHI